MLIVKSHTALIHEACIRMALESDDEHGDCEMCNAAKPECARLPHGSERMWGIARYPALDQQIANASVGIRSRFECRVTLRDALAAIKVPIMGKGALYALMPLAGLAFIRKFATVKSPIKVFTSLQYLYLAIPLGG